MIVNNTVRPPLGLPPGSVRGIISLLITVMAWLLLLLPDSIHITIPLNLYCLLTLVLLFFFSHGKSIAEAQDPHPSPLYLPGGTIRIFIVLGTLAVLGHLYYHHPARLEQRLQPSVDQMVLWPTLLGSLFSGLLLGYVCKYMPFRNHWFFQSLQAWISMLSILTMLAELVIQAFIAPKITEEFNLVVWQCIVTFLAAVYFGTRT